MVKIKLDKPWTYRDGVNRSIDYPAGEHDVANDVAAAAEAEGVIGAATEKPKAGK